MSDFVQPTQLFKGVSNVFEPTIVVKNPSTDFILQGWAIYMCENKKTEIIEITRSTSCIKANAKQEYK